MRRSGKAWERRQRRLNYAKDLIESAFVKRAEKVSAKRNLFDDPQIKKLMRRRDRILRGQRPRRRAKHKKSR
jgi:hypothetical protein